MLSFFGFLSDIYLVKVPKVILKIIVKWILIEREKKTHVIIIIVFISIRISQANCTNERCDFIFQHLLKTPSMQDSSDITFIFKCSFFFLRIFPRRPLAPPTAEEATTTMDSPERGSPGGTMGSESDRSWHPLDWHTMHFLRNIVSMDVHLDVIYFVHR